MMLVSLAAVIMFTLATAAKANKIGYFWHITDIHWDPYYGTKDSSCQKTSPPKQTGQYGDYHCDASWSLVESAAQAMLRIKDDVEFILWTGDSLSRSIKLSKMAALTNLTNLISHVFSSHSVFPVIGQNDPDPWLAPTNHSEEPYKNYSNLWKLWLPTEALDTFIKGGYYTIEQRKKRLRLVVLNTNLLGTGSGMKVGAEEDPAGQWAWLDTVLKNSRIKNETVYLVGHTPPGLDDRADNSLKFPMMSHHSSKYVSLVRNYSDIITGQFFGSLHSDTFRIVYNDKGAPVSRLLIAPSVTPCRSSGGYPSSNNPGVRLYKIDIDTGQVLDYSQYFLDLEKIHEEEEPEWQLIYNFTDYYSLAEPSAEELHVLAENFTSSLPEPPATQDNTDTFSK